MGEIVAAVALSHAPGLTGWLDRATPEVQRNLTEGYESLGRMLRDAKPDVLVLHSSKAGLAGRLALRGAVPTIFCPNA